MALVSSHINGYNYLIKLKSVQLESEWVFRMGQNMQLNKQLPIDKQQIKDVIKLPVARLFFSGEKITHLSFNDDGSPGINGTFNLQVKSGYRKKMVWGGNALLQVACKILDKLPSEHQTNITRSPFHTPFFKEAAKSDDGIISRHNNYECVCGGKEKACAKSPQRQG
jgi:hypothetical protein